MNGRGLQRIVVGPSRPAERTPRAKRFRRQATPRPMHLTDRDVTALEALARHRILSGDQLRRLVFDCSGSRVRRRLRALYDHGFVERISLVAQPAKGVPPLVYSLSARGAEALAELDIAAEGGGGRGIGLQFARHRLAVNELFVTLTEATRGTRYAIRDWRHEQELKLPTDDGRGRVERVEHPSLRGPVSFLPDGYFQLDLGNGASLAYFVEVDLATHSQRVWRQRAQLYTAYADPRVGLFRQRFGRESFRLLIVTTPDYRRRSRRDNILQSIHSTIGSSRLFVAATLTDVDPARVLGHVWHMPGVRESVSITDANSRRVAVTPAARPRVSVRRQG